MVEENPQGRPKHLYTTQNAGIDAKIQEITRSLEVDEFDRTLIAEMITSAYRFGLDGASTLDLKIINSAVKELRYAFNIFQPYRHLQKVAVFGSARTPKGRPYYNIANEFGQIMSKAGWMTITGAASGIMKAANEGAGREASFGLNIRLPFEQEANPIVAKDRKLITCKYFFTRKLLFIKESQATVLFPGGFGTLDEGFECLTLVQTGKADPRPIVFADVADGHFWRPLLEFMEQRLFKEGMVSSYDHAIYHVARSPQEAADAILRFYSVYHSMRYVGDHLVLRLNRRLPEKTVARLSYDFQDMILEGGIQQGKALEEEKESQGDEPELKDLPRLIFRFNRKDYGRLMELIHRINGAEPSGSVGTP